MAAAAVAPLPGMPPHPPSAADIVEEDPTPGSIARQESSSRSSEASATAAVAPPPGLLAAAPLAEASTTTEVAECWAPPHMSDAGQDGEEAFLTDMLTKMDHYLRCLRESQQRLVNIVELACRTALGNRFGRLVLVGSVALCAETPGSDVDVVCFTRDSEDEAAAMGLPTENLRKSQLRKVLEQLVSLTTGHFVGASSAMAPGYAMELIEDARVPVLRVVWGAPTQGIAVDILVDQRRPLDHVRWFQSVHASPSPNFTTPSAAPNVTVTLRCIKWWLRQRQIPRTKEGGLPTIAWLLLALHISALPETQKEVSEKSTMFALLHCLSSFFREYSAPGALHGVLRFNNQADEVEKFSSEFRRSPRSSESPWSELVVLDPTQANEDLNLAPSLSPATQLLLTYELQRAAGYLQELQNQIQKRQQPDSKSHSYLEDVFEPVPHLKNFLPAFSPEPLTALLLQGNPSKGVGSLEVAIIDKIAPRPGWNADFLHRFDTSSVLHARVCDVNEANGSCMPRREGYVVLCPCHFVCMVAFQRDGTKFKLNEHDLEIFRNMKGMLAELQRHQRALGDLSHDLNPPQCDYGLADKALADKAAVASGGGRSKITKRGKKKNKAA